MLDLREEGRGAPMAVVIKHDTMWQVSMTPCDAVGNWPAAEITQAGAIDVARRMLARIGGGTLIVHDRRGRVREALNVATARPREPTA